MKFTEFLNEAPLEIDLQNDEYMLMNKYEKLSHKMPIRSDEFKDYELLVYDSPFKNNEETIVMENDIPVLYVSQYVEKINGKTLIKNAYVNKNKKLSTSSLIDILFHLNKEYDGMVSDDTQSTGGKKLWKSLMQEALNKNYNIGIYNNMSGKIVFKEPNISFNVWYSLKNREIYSRTNLISTTYQLVIIK